MQSYNNASKGPQLGSMLVGRDEERKRRKNETSNDGDEDESLGRDDTQLNQQDSEPTPVGLTLFAKQKSTNVVTPYNFADDFGGVKKPNKKLGSRYEEDDDFSRDLCPADDLEEDIGIGEADNDDGPPTTGVLFDEEDLFGDKVGRKKKALKNNRSKMMLDELEGGDAVGETEHSFR